MERVTELKLTKDAMFYNKFISKVIKNRKKNVLLKLCKWRFFKNLIIILLTREKPGGSKITEFVW